MKKAFCFFIIVLMFVLELVFPLNTAPMPTAPPIVPVDLGSNLYFISKHNISKEMTKAEINSINASLAKLLKSNYFDIKNLVISEYGMYIIVQ